MAQHQPAPNALESAYCPVCASPGEPVPGTLTDLNTRLPGEFGLRRCHPCDLFFLSPRPTEERIAFYYPDEYSPYTVGNQALRRGLPFIGAPSRRVRLVKRFVNGGRILDVGCGSGVFLEVLGAQGWQRHAMDIADHSRLQDQNVPFFAGHFDAQPPPLDSLDAITLWHVFEHLYHPHQALQNAYALLKPGGFLFLAVPDLDCPDRHLFGRSWIGWDPPRHLATYSRKSMEILLRRANFQLQAVLPDAINGSTVALCCDFALRARGIQTQRLWSSLPVHLVLTPWAELTRLAGVAQAKVYVATRTT